MCKKLFCLITCVLVLGFASGVATAESVVYYLTATSSADFGGTITLDLSVDPSDTENEGQMNLYHWGDGAITAFSLTINGKSFTEEDADGDFDLGLASADDSLFLIFMDLDTDNGSIFGELVVPEDEVSDDFIGVEGAALNDDPCEAAKAKGVDMLLSDFNLDCVTNLADFAILAADWLATADDLVYFAEFASEWLESTALEAPEAPVE
jgi:hypothetical protein